MPFYPIYGSTPGIVDTRAAPPPGYWEKGILFEIDHKNKLNDRCYYSEIRCILLRVSQTSNGFWVFLFRQSFWWRRGHANHNATCSPSLTENDSRLLKNSEGNRDGEWIFCRGKEADVASFLQLAKIRNIRKICEADLTSRLFPETVRSQSNEPWNTKQTKRIEIHQSWIANHDLLNSCK